MDEETAKRQRRLEKNRVSAQRSRQRKKERVSALTQKLRGLEAENLELRLKLRVGREYAREESKESTALLARMKEIIGSSEGTVRETSIKHELAEMESRFSDYGRDRSSAFAFHLSQLRRSLRATTTTRSLLWFISMARQFISEDGVLLDPPLCKDEEVCALFASACEDVQPEMHQLKSMYDFNDPSVAPWSRLEELSKDTFAIIARLDELVTERTTSLEDHMRSLSQTVSPTQVAKFILWADNNPMLLQLVSKLLGPVFVDRVDTEPSSLGSGDAGENPFSILL